MKLILASASLRRLELLKRITEDFQVIVSGFDENSVPYLGDVEAYVKAISQGKAESISKLHGDSIVIGCDTVVVLDNKILGKPSNENEAFQMLTLLSGKTHEVWSGITVICKDNSFVRSCAVVTKVKFSQLSKEEIIRYVNTGEPMDKAGAYGIQGYGGVFVERIEGCYYNVVGLPLNKLNTIFIEMGVNL